METEKRVDFHFLGVLGLDGTDVSAKATVQIASYGGGNGLVPFGLVASNDSNSTLLQNSCFNGWENGEPTFKQNMACTMKFGAGSNSGGDFGALSLDSSGGSTYRDNIGQWFEQRLPEGRQSTFRDGKHERPDEAGDRRLAGNCTPLGVSDRRENGSPGIQHQRPGRNRRLRYARSCKHHPRIILIPVVDKINNPQISTILGFAFMWPESTSNQGGQASVVGEFVQFVTEIPGGIYEGNNGGSTIVKLIQ